MKKTTPKITALGFKTKAKIKQLEPISIGKYGKNGALNGLSNSFLLYLRLTAAKFTKANPNK